MIKNHDELKVIGIKDFEEHDDMYKVVDFLNKNLKNYGIIFGLSRKDGKNTISIYDTENRVNE